MTIFPVSDVINVSISDTPSGLTGKNVNSLALFTNDPSNSIQQFGVYISATQVAADYGTNSITAQMANAVFAQNPNILSGGGRLIIIPMRAAQSAASGLFTTTNLSANLVNIIGVTAGDLKITANSVDYNLTGMNFTNCLTFTDVAEVIQNHIVDVTVAAITNGLSFTSKKVGTASSVALGAVSGGSGTPLNGTGFINAAAGTTTAGTNSSGETILQAIQRTSGLIGYVPLMTTLNLEDAAIIAASNGIESLDNMYLQHVSSTQDILGICTTIQQAENTKTRMLLHTDGQTSANLFKAAYAGRAFSVDFNGSNTAITMNLKDLATIQPDSGLTETLRTEANTAGVDLYISYDGVPSVYSTQGNDFFDNPYSDLALKFALQTAGFNFLRQTNTKVPQTESGMNGLKNVFSLICEQFVRNACIAPGQWNSADTFGDPQIFNNNILLNGFYVYSLPVAQQDQADRGARIAPLVQIAIKRAGAIQSVIVNVLVNN